MKPRLPILIACLLLCAHALVLAAEKPNVVVILVDDMGYGDIAAHGKVKAASASNALIEYVDVVPTFLEMAGLERPAILEGRSFLPVLTGEAATHKTHVYGLQTTRSIVGGSDHFGIRSVRDARYRYIRNLTPEATFQNLTTKDRTFKTWVKMAAAGATHAQQLVHDYQHRPAEELYDCDAAPWNRHNLVNDSKLADKLTELRAKLDAWMKQQGDTGQATEMKAHERMPRKRSDEHAANTD